MADKCRELELGWGFTQAWNARCGTDYVVRPREDVADFAMVSLSKRFPMELVQLVSIPIVNGRKNLEYREDYDKIRKLEKAVQTELEHRGATDVAVRLGFTPAVYTAKVPKHTAQQVADWVLADLRDDVVELDLNEHYDQDPELGDILAYLLWMRLPGLGHVEVHSSLGGFDQDGSGWIRQAIDEKATQYGGTKQVANVILLIVGSVFLEEGHVQRFLTSHQPSELPFKQIWVQGPFCLLQAIKSGPRFGA